MTAHAPIVLLGDISAEHLAALRAYLSPPLPARPALPAETVTPGLLDIVALRASHFAHGHTIQADLENRGPGQIAKAGRSYLTDAIDLLDRGPAERARARIKITRAAALLLAELDRIDAQDARETLPTRNGEAA